MSKEETKAVATKADNSALSIAGSVMPSDFDAFVTGAEGFASVETVVFGDPELRKIPLYVGVLQGPTDAVEVGEEIFDRRTGEVKRNKMECWVFKPMVKDKHDGKTTVAENVTHIVPCNYQVDAACKRIWAECQRRSCSAIVGIKFMGKETIKNGSRQLNRYQVFEKYIPKQAA